MDSITNEDKLKCVKRELAMRRNVYPKWVVSGRMKQEQADREIAVMAEVVEDYERRPALIDAAASVVTQSKDFRIGMPEGWEGDPLTDACEDLEDALLR